MGLTITVDGKEVNQDDFEINSILESNGIKSNLSISVNIRESYKLPDPEFTRILEFNTEL